MHAHWNLSRAHIISRTTVSWPSSWPCQQRTNSAIYTIDIIQSLQAWLRLLIWVCRPSVRLYDWINIQKKYPHPYLFPHIQTYTQSVIVWHDSHKDWFLLSNVDSVGNYEHVSAHSCDLMRPTQIQSANNSNKYIYRNSSTGTSTQNRSYVCLSKHVLSFIVLYCMQFTHTWLKHYPTEA
jgi:hypothetical protein